MECCRSHVIKSIEAAKPRLVVGLGTVPLSWALGSSDMSGMRGRVFAMKFGTHQCWFMPTYHPAFILRVAYNKDKPLNSRLGHCLRMDIQRAFLLYNSLPPAKVDTEAEARAGVQCFDGTGGYDALLALLKRASKARYKAIDLETQGLRPYGAGALLLTAAISFDDVNFSFALNHPKAKWSANERLRIDQEFQDILKDGSKKIAHNAPFELEWLINEYGKEIVNHSAWECTMMQAHFLDERRGNQAQGDDNDSRRAAYQKLDFLCKQHFGIPYKNLFKFDKRNMAKEDIGDVLTYNGVDTKYTLRLWKLQRYLLKASDLWDAYQEALPRQPTVALMQYLGIDVDQTEVKHVQGELEKELKAIDRDIKALKVVKKFIADRGQFVPLGPDCLTIFKDYLKCPEVRVDEKSNFDFDKPSANKKKIAAKENAPPKYSVDKNVLEKISHPLAGLVLQLRNITKTKSTYVDCFVLGEGTLVWPDKKIHTSFNTTFTETGRTSSDEPNMQNFPKRNDAWVRRIVVPPKNHILLACDYGQLEGCTAAMCSRDKVLVKALWDEYDIHREWMERLVKRYPLWLGGTETIEDKNTAKKYRSIAKNKLVFPAIFGAQNESIAGYLNIPIEVADDLMDDFWGIFTGLKNWQEALMKNYYETGYVSSPTGRWHRYPLSRNQVINFPVQGVASDIVCDSMNVLSQHALKTGQWHLHPHLNIHDDLTFIIPDDKKIIEESMQTIYEVMLTPQYDFINVPLSVEMSTGYNWYEMKEVGKFWSNKHV